MSDMDPFDAEIMTAVDATVAAARAEIDTLRAQVEEARRDRDALDDEAQRLRRAANIAIAERDAALSDAARLREALAFYADPDSYFAVSFMVDPPAGEFADDFSEDHDGDYDRAMPGKRARAALAPAVPGGER